MLNTDQHNAQVKKRMTQFEFLRNNRGIDEGKDLPEEFLKDIYDEISSNEIIMKDEKPKVIQAQEKTLFDAIIPVIKSKETSENMASLASENMALKTEAIKTFNFRLYTAI